MFYTGNWAKVKTHSKTRKGIIEVAFNTDGISPFKSSRLSVWPLFVSVLNLPPYLRCLKHNIVTYIFWVATSKPPMNCFLRKFKKMIDKLNATGLKTTGTKTFSIKPLYGVFDMIAKAPLMNMNQHNGKYGCPSCLHPGLRLGHTQTYPPGDFTEQSFENAAAKAERISSVVDGIKGKTVLSKIIDIAT